MMTKLKVVFAGPVYNEAAHEERGPFDCVWRIGRRLLGGTRVPGQRDRLVVISEEDDVYGGKIRGQIKCHKVDGCADMDDAYFGGYFIAAVDQFEGHAEERIAACTGSDPGDDPDYVGA